MEIKEENILNAYKEGDENVKKLLHGLFPQIEFKGSSIMERIKTFEDACDEIGEGSYLYHAYETVETMWRGSKFDYKYADLLAFTKLHIIVAALNEGWQPTFGEDEMRWYPYFTLWTKEEFREKSTEWKNENSLVQLDNYVTKYECLSYTYTAMVSHSELINHHLYLKSEELAEYCGKQFIELWADYLLPQIPY